MVKHRKKNISKEFRSSGCARFPHSEDCGYGQVPHSQNPGTHLPPPGRYLQRRSLQNRSAWHRPQTDGRSIHCDNVYQSPYVQLPPALPPGRYGSHPPLLLLPVRASQLPDAQMEADGSKLLHSCPLNSTFLFFHRIPGTYRSRCYS